MSLKPYSIVGAELWLCFATWCLLNMVGMLHSLFTLAQRYRTILPLPERSFGSGIAIHGRFRSRFSYYCSVATNDRFLYPFSRFALFPTLAIPWDDILVKASKSPLKLFRPRLLLHDAPGISLSMPRSNLERLLQQSGIGLGPLTGLTPLTHEPSSPTEIFIKPRQR